MEPSNSDIESRALAGDLSAQRRTARTLLEEGQLDASRLWLRRAAETGPADIKLAPAENLLTYVPYDVPEAVRWTQRAAEGGSAEAVHRLAVLAPGLCDWLIERAGPHQNAPAPLGLASSGKPPGPRICWPRRSKIGQAAVEGPLSAEAVHLMALHAGEGVGVPQDWGTALDLLLRSAELGWPLAQASLAGLAGEWALARDLAKGGGTASDWKRLRGAIDLGKWFAVPKMSILSASPRVAVIESFASPEICDWLIERARMRLGPARVFDLLSGAPTHEAVRDNTECYFPVDEGDLVLQFLRSRIATVTELFVAGMEAPSVLHYTQGQRFLPHYDFLDDAHPGHAAEIARGGQRVLTFLLSLNDDYEGGETQFPILGKRYRGRKGNALFFWNVEPDGTPDKRVLHAGLTPTLGEKWILSQWIRGRF